MFLVAIASLLLTASPLDECRQLTSPDLRLACYDAIPSGELAPDQWIDLDAVELTLHPTRVDCPLRLQRTVTRKAIGSGLAVSRSRQFECEDTSLYVAKLDSIRNGDEIQVEVELQIRVLPSYDRMTDVDMILVGPVKELRTRWTNLNTEEGKIKTVRQVLRVSAQDWPSYFDEEGNSKLRFLIHVDEG